MYLFWGMTKCKVFEGTYHLRVRVIRSIFEISYSVEPTALQVGLTLTASGRESCQGLGKDIPQVSSNVFGRKLNSRRPSFLQQGEFKCTGYALNNHRRACHKKGKAWQQHIGQRQPVSNRMFWLTENVLRNIAALKWRVKKFDFTPWSLCDLDLPVISDEAVPGHHVIGSESEYSGPMFFGVPALLKICFSETCQVD